MATMSATEARVHFGEVFRRMRDNEIITVEHGDKPEAVFHSVEDYQRLRDAQPDVDTLVGASLKSIASGSIGNLGTGRSRMSSMSFVGCGMSAMQTSWTACVDASVTLPFIAGRSNGAVERP